MTVITNIKKKNGSAFVIEPFNEESNSPLGYDLTIGFAVILDERHQNSFNENGEMTLAPRSSVLVITREFVWLSGNYLATLHARGSMAARGLFLNSTTVDPNWKGQMTMLIFNTSNNEVILKKNERFITLIIHKTEQYIDRDPGRGPLKVANAFGELYGNYFVKELSSYLLHDNDKKYSFERKVDEAKRHLLTNINYLKHIATSSSITKKILVFTLITSLILTLLSNFFWDKMKNFLGINVPYDSTIFSGLFGGVISLAALIISIQKDRKTLTNANNHENN